jgi:hypothetical protein
MGRETDKRGDAASARRVKVRQRSEARGEGGVTEAGNGAEPAGLVRRLRTRVNEPVDPSSAVGGR